MPSSLAIARPKLLQVRWFARLYAWVLLILGLVALLEFLLLQPVQRRLTRWQEPSHA